MTDSPNNMKPDNAPRRRTWLVVACAAAAVVGALLVVGFRPREQAVEPPASGDALDVPLGVEEAVIIRYDGPPLVARPYRRGASINLRIAEAVPVDGVTVYDVRYVVNLPGEFDLTDYLASADGASLDGLPSFRVRGQTRLTKTIETRIREIEVVQIHIWHGYYETLAALGLFWIAWLAGLVFVGREPAPRKIAPTTTPTPLDERIRARLSVLENRDLTTEEKAELEALLLAYWKEQTTSHGDRRLAVACRLLRDDSNFARAYETLQAWLHRPTRDVDAREVVASCAPGASRTSASEDSPS